jgi:SH3-like domain-containing protein
LAFPDKIKNTEESMKKGLLLLSFFSILIIFTSTSHALCVNVPEANLREGPGTKHDKTWEVYKYMPFKKIGEKGNWYKVSDVDGDTHWIYKKLVTSKIECAVVKVDKANLRTGPGTNYKQSPLGPADKYVTFKVIKRQGSWVKVMDELGETGWIFRKLVWIY